MNRKLLTVLLVIVMLMSATLSACGGSEAGGSAEHSETEAKTASVPEAGEHGQAAPDTGAHGGDAGANNAHKSTAPESTEPQSNRPWPRVVLDIQGARFELDEPVRRIVSLSPGVTEILFALGAGDLLVGVDTWSDYPQEALSIEKVGDFSSPSVEKIVAMEPDLVFSSATLHEDQTKALRDMGIEVAVCDARALSELYQSIALIVSFLPDEYIEPAEELILALYERQVALIEAAQEIKIKPRAYYVMSFGSSGNWTSGPGSFINEMMELAGAKTITNDAGNAWIEFSLETMVERDPDIIFLASDYNPADLAAAAGYSELDSVKNGSVVVIDADTVSRPGPRMMDALEFMADEIRRIMGEN